MTLLTLIGVLLSLHSADYELVFHPFLFLLLEGQSGINKGDSVALCNHEYHPYFIAKKNCTGNYLEIECKVFIEKMLMQSGKTVDIFSLCKDIQIHGNMRSRFDIKVFLNMLQ